MPTIDIAGLPVETGTMYPDPFWKATVGRERKRLGNAVGLTQFGVNLTTLKPGAWSSQRHWHQNEDELIYVLAGELVLCQDAGETILKPGDAAGWKAGATDGHCLINQTDRDAVYLEIGTRAATERATCSDIDMKVERDERGPVYSRKSNGEPYPKRSA
jgi:uncharacterized cupin superfamily protein